jgi:hypothetical protein
MNEGLINVVLQYLDIETNYGLIIDGKYGIGKTHFFKKILIPKIENTILSENTQKKYLAVHISLFGLKNIEEIKAEIFMSLYSILKNKKVRFTNAITKSIIRGAANIVGIKETNTILEELEKTVIDVALDYNKLVICFDDIDRKSEPLIITDFFGFINFLVEDGGKILLIANEEKLLEDEKYTSQLKEKVIGVSVHYFPDIEKVFDEILKERYENPFKLYFNYIIENRERIIEIVKVNDNNFRNLIFFLEHFRIVFSELENLFQVEDDFKVSQAEKIKAVFDFSIAVFIEYKLGKINVNNLNIFQGMNSSSLYSIELSGALAKDLNKNKTEEKDDQEPSYTEVFLKKYFSTSKYYFFESIFEYGTGSRAFEIHKLKDEIQKYFLVEEGNIARHIVIFNKLSYSNHSYLRLTDSQYKALTYEMLKYVDKGVYTLKDYTTVFHFATRFNNVLNMNIGKLKKRFKKGIEKGFNKYDYVDQLDFYLMVTDGTEFKEDVLEIRKHCLSINEAIGKANNKQNQENIIQLLENDFEEFMKQVNSDQYSPFWNDIPLKKIMLSLNKIEKFQIIRLANYFNNRYRRYIYEGLYPEKEFVTNFIDTIDNPTKKRKIRNLRNRCLDFLSKTLKECESNFS